jgi:hypothetical protein
MAAFAWISVMFEQQMCYRVPGPIKCEAIVPVEVSVVESYLDGKDDLQDFLQHLNNIHKSIEFTMKAEQDRTLPFLDVLVSRRLDGTLGHTVYRKLTHTDLYLHAKSEYHLEQKRAVLTTLIQCARILCDLDSLRKETEHLRDTFQRNRYSKSKIR